MAPKFDNANASGPLNSSVPRDFLVRYLPGPWPNSPIEGHAKNAALKAPRFRVRCRTCPFGKSARRGRRDIALALHDDLVERPEIGFGRSHQRVRIGTF